MSEQYIFMRLEATHASGSLPAELPPGYGRELWQPGRRRVVSASFPVHPFGTWWLAHHMHLFANQEYGLLLIRYGPELVHRSVVTPRYFRFPFMEADDLQIGFTWTSPDHRGHGLATVALSTILAEKARPGRAFWYVVADSNAPSIRVAERVGFRRVGVGYRGRRLGLRLLGSFVISSTTQ